MVVTYVLLIEKGGEVAQPPGGEFFIADGAKIVNDLDKDVLKRIYENKVRISVSNLDLNFLSGLPEGFREQATPAKMGSPDIPPRGHPLIV